MILILQCINIEAVLIIKFEVENHIHHYLRYIHKNNEMESNMEQKVNKRLNSIAWLRFIAIIMIVYDHLVGFRKPDYIVNRFFDALLNKPLHIIQSYGAFGVSLFFLISGFLIMNTNDGNEKISLKIIKKIIRIYLSVLISFLSFAFLQWILNKFMETYWAQFSKKQWIESASLLGYFTGSGDVINGTTWFLIPLFMFYLFSIYIIAEANRNYERAVIGAEAILSVLTLGLFILKKVYFIEFAVTNNFVFIFIPMTGVILYGIFKKKMNFWKSIFVLFYNYCVFAGALYEFNTEYYTDSPYLVSYIYATTLFVLFVLGEHHFSSNGVVEFIGKIGLPIYLLHMTWGAAFISLLESFVPFTFAVIFTLIFVIVIAWIHDKYIDKIVIKKIVK